MPAMRAPFNFRRTRSWEPDRLWRWRTYGIEVGRSSGNADQAWAAPPRILPPSISTPRSRPSTREATCSGATPQRLRRGFDGLPCDFLAQVRVAHVRVAGIHQNGSCDAASTASGCKFLARDFHRRGHHQILREHGGGDGGAIRHDQRDVVFRDLANPRVGRGETAKPAGKFIPEPRQFAGVNPFKNAAVVIRFLPSN